MPPLPDDVRYSFVIDKFYSPGGLLLYTKCACAALRPPAVGGFRQTTIDRVGLISRRRGVGRPIDYPVVPGGAGTGAASLAVE